MLAVSKKAHKALIKLLLKTNLVEKGASEGFQFGGDHFPVHYFAAHDAFEESDALQILSKQIGIPLFQFELSAVKQYCDALSKPPLSHIAISEWQTLKALPVDQTDSDVIVAMANPLDADLKIALEFKLGRKVQLVLGSEEEILAVSKAIVKQGGSVDLSSILKQAESGDQPQVEAPVITEHDSASIENDLEAAPVVRLTGKILADSVRADASDIHVSPDKTGLTVRIRVDGIMRDLYSVPKHLVAPVISRLKLLSGMDISERRRPQDGRIRISTNQGVKDLRVSTVPSAFGENLVARILSSDLQGISFDGLGMDPAIAKRIKHALQGSSRVVLVTGPTGSGKTSTLYASLLHLRDGQTHIMTVEDPIEYRIDGITQIQVKSDIGMTFAASLRSILRQDPDVVMIGEIRDPETAEIAMQVAQTGHLVLSTIHTNTAAAAVTRLMDLQIPPYLIASSLGFVVAQRLVRKLCNECKTDISEESKKRYIELGLDPAGKKQAKGCPQCGESGYKGRAPIYSILEISDKIRDAIKEKRGEREIEALAREGGFLSLEGAGLELVQKGIVALEELERSVGPLDMFADEGHSVQLGPKASGPGPAKPSSKGFAKRKVLLIEDNTDARSVLCMLLEREMFEVIEAANGREGIEKLYEAVPELIICDLMMPEMNGVDFVEKVRQDARTRNIPILMLTALDSEEREEQLLLAGADDFMSKATSPAILVARVQRLLNRSA